MWSELIKAFGEQAIASLKKYPFLAIAFFAVGATGAVGWVKFVEVFQLYIHANDKLIDSERSRANLAEDKFKLLEDQARQDAKYRELLENELKNERNPQQSP